MNAKATKNVSDCQWIQQLHTYGLLEASFRPPADICTLRAYVRQRENLLQQRSIHIQHMQKALQLMNLKLTTVLSDITGQTGMQIIEAILEGEHDPVTLAQFRNPRCLSPNNKSSAGKTYSRHSRKTNNRANKALRLAAQAVSRSQSALGAFYRRIKARHGAPIVITATAHKLARIVYRMLKDKVPYQQQDQQQYNEQQEARVFSRLQRQAQKFDFTLVPELQPDSVQ